MRRVHPPPVRTHPNRDIRPLRAPVRAAYYGRMSANAPPQFVLLSLQAQGGNGSNCLKMSHFVSFLSQNVLIKRLKLSHAENARNTAVANKTTPQ